MEENADDYWGSSSVKNSRKQTNMFDDDVTIEKASEIARFRKVLSFDEDEDDSIGWGDDPTTKPSTLNNTSSQSSNIPSKPAPTNTSAGSCPRPSFDANPSAMAQRAIGSSSPSFMTHTRSRSEVLVGGKMVVSESEPAGFSISASGSRSSLTGVSQQTAKGDSEPTLNDMINRPKPTFTAGPISDKDEELQYLRKQLEYATRAMGGSKPKVKDTITRMLLGQPYSLEQYRSKVEKIGLLDQALKTHDGNAIIAVVMFLKRTLKEQLFNLELMKHPVAIDHYMTYLKAYYNHREYEHMLQLLGRTEEQAMLKYKQAASVEDSAVKIDKLKQCLHAHFQHSPGMETDSGLIQQHIALLQRQRPVDVGDDMAEKEGRHVVMRTKPRVASIVNMSVITTLYYCCIYHYDEPENLLSSPAAIRKEHQLSEKQYVWTALRARAGLHKWNDIEALFMTKGFFGGTKMKSVVPFEKVATILHRCDAPAEIVAKYLKLVDDVDRRLEVANKLQCHDAVIETYASQRDRRTLEAYASRCKPNSREWFMAKGALADKTIKWKS